MLKFIASRMRALQICLDALLICAAWLVAYLIRFNFIKEAQTGVEATFQIWVLPLVILTLYFLMKNGLYDRRRLLSATSDIMQILRANALSLVSFVVLLYFVSEVRISRLTIVLYAGISMFLLAASRLFMRSAVRKLRRRGYLLQRVVLVGDGPQLDQYLNMISYTPGTGLAVVNWFGSPRASSFNFRASDLGELDSFLESKQADDQPDFVVLGFESEDDPHVSAFVSKHYDSLFQIQVLASSHRSLIGMATETMGDVQVLSLNQPRFSLAELSVKRGLDIVASAIGLVVLSLPLSLIAIAVKLSSPGPVFFGQERVGLDGKRFKMWKFRSMRAASKEESIGWTVENDPRRTAVGTFLRKTSIDELPQLWNVLTGEMSLVGPRPEQPFFVEKFRREIPAYMLRHKMKAGITGWAQVSGWRGDTSLHKRIECDLYYIRNWSLWFDVKILFLTVIRGFINKNAY